MIHIKYHVIHNFPKDYPLYKKIGFNIIFFFTGMVIHERKNSLSHKDLLKATMILKKGDIILVGNLKTLYSSLMKEAITHSALYIGNRRFIHSMIDEGVEYSPLHKIFTNYDTMAILRLPKNNKKVIKKAIEFAKSKYGEPYDLDFTGKGDSFFCSELINSAFKKAGYNTGLKTLRKQQKLTKRIEEKLSHAVDALNPAEFPKGNFEIKFMSHNLKLKNKRFILKKD